jgi:serine/threonine-protein kinase RsbW
MFFQHFQQMNHHPPLSPVTELNHLRHTGIWHVPCLIQGMAQKFQVEFGDTAQTHTFAQLPGTARSGPSVELRQSLASQVEAIEPFTEQLMRFISKFRKLDGSETGIELAVHEALVNAVVHGNQMDPNKRVCVACRCYIDGEVSITIRDQGQGFDSSSIPDPTAPENQLSAHGRGIYLMQASMDEVHFEEGGVVARMRKKPNAGADEDQGSQIRRNHE